MENSVNHLLQCDAAPVSSTSTEIVEISTENLALESRANNNRVIENNMILANQTNSSSVIRFDNCNGVTLGSIFNIGFPTRNNVVAQPNIGTIEKFKEEPYGKTPTIKEMMKCTELISPAFLDILSGLFGARWKEAMILLQINQLFVERMIEDYSERGGVKEVIEFSLNWNR